MSLVEVSSEKGKFVYPSFGRRLREVVVAGVAGSLKKSPMIADDLAAGEIIRSKRAYSNPPEEQIIESCLQFFPERRIPSSHLYTVPDSQLAISKAQFLQVMSAFSDQHQIPALEHLFAPRLSRKFVEEVMEKTDNLGRQTTLPEQLEIAMELAGGRLLASVLLAHAGSRAIARGSENRVSSFLFFIKEEMERWRDCVSFFPNSKDGYGDPPGDTYHFWGAFAAALLSNIRLRKRDIFLNPLYCHLYQNVAWYTRFLRYGLAGWRGNTHEQADGMGWRVGYQLIKKLNVG